MSKPLRQPLLSTPTVMSGSVDPAEQTENGYDDLRRPPGGGWRAAFFIIFVEMAERFTYYGLVANLITFLTEELGQLTLEAAKMVNTWVGVASIFPVMGAFLADCFLGRFNTVLASSFVYLAGLVVVVLSVTVTPASKREAVFFVGLYVVAFGGGGHKPCVQTFAADQFDDDDAHSRAQKSSFFNWWYLFLVTGGTLSTIVVVYIQERVGWAAGFGVLTGIVAGAMVVFLAGIKLYRKDGAPSDGPFTSVVQVFIAAARKWNVDETRSNYGIFYGDDHGREAYGLRSQPKRRTRSLAHTNQFRLLDKAAIIDDIDASDRHRNPWRLCSVSQVEEAKLIVRLVPISILCLMYCATIVQLYTFFTKQGSTMDRNIGGSFTVPAATLQTYVGVVILVAIPIYDRVFVPFAQRITKRPSGITILQRIGAGFFMSVLAMAVAALVEATRVRVAKDHGLVDSPKATVPMNICWLLPQYTMIAIGDVLTLIGMTELFYDQVPEKLRSVGFAVFLGLVGIGSFLNSAIISVVQAVSDHRWLGNNLNRARLDALYWIFAGLNALNLCVYVFVANKFVYKRLRDEDEAAGLEDNQI